MHSTLEDWLCAWPSVIEIFKNINSNFAKIELECSTSCVRRFWALQRSRLPEFSSIPRSWSVPSLKAHSSPRRSFPYRLGLLDVDQTTGDKEAEVGPQHVARMQDVGSRRVQGHALGRTHCCFIECKISRFCSTQTRTLDKRTIDFAFPLHLSVTLLLHGCHR